MTRERLPISCNYLDRAAMVRSHLKISGGRLENCHARLRLILPFGARIMPREIVLHKFAAGREELVDLERERGSARLQRAFGGAGLGDSAHNPAVLRRLAPNVILKEASEVSSRDEFERSGWDDGHYSPLPG